MLADTIRADIFPCGQFPISRTSAWPRSSSVSTSSPACKTPTTVYMCMYVCIGYIYIYIYIEGERERDRVRVRVIYPHCSSGYLLFNLTGTFTHRPSLIMCVSCGIPSRHHSSPLHFTLHSLIPFALQPPLTHPLCT